MAKASGKPGVKGKMTKKAGGKPRRATKVRRPAAKKGRGKRKYGGR